MLWDANPIGDRDWLRGYPSGRIANPDLRPLSLLSKKMLHCIKNG